MHSWLVCSSSIELLIPITCSVWLDKCWQSCTCSWSWTWTNVWSGIPKNWFRDTATDPVVCSRWRRNSKYVKYQCGFSNYFSALSCSNSNFAGRGAAFDYAITGSMVIITPGSNTFATITIRVDGVALEPDETFQLKLVADPPPPRIFCLDTLDVVIEDGDGIANNNYYVWEWLLCMISHSCTYTQSRLLYTVYVEGN